MADGIATTAELEAQGVSALSRTQLVQEGLLIRLRNGWFAVPEADRERMRAIRVGGRVTCATALRQHGLWVMPDARLHIAVAGNASRMRSPENRSRPWNSHDHPDIELHWRGYPWDASPTATIDSVQSSIAHLIRCATREAAIVTIDSALNGTSSGRSLLTKRELSRIFEVLPAKYRAIEDMVDENAQSGLESLARIRLRALKVRVRTQVQIENVGSVDVLIGERLVLELDSRAHHLGDNYEKDRARDLELFRQGFSVLRVSYRRVMYDWPSIEDAIMQAVRRDDHLRRGMHDRLGLALT
jgi:very-short-patch-repair endonuclease